MHTAEWVFAACMHITYSKEGLGGHGGMRRLNAHRTFVTNCIIHPQVYDAHGEEGLKGGAPPPGADAAGPGGPGFTSFSFGPGANSFSYSGVDAARAANIFANIFGGNGGGMFFSGDEAGPGPGPGRSRVRMFSRRGGGGPAGLHDLFGDGGMDAGPAGSGTRGFAFAGHGRLPRAG